MRDSHRRLHGRKAQKKTAGTGGKGEREKEEMKPRDSERGGRVAGRETRMRTGDSS